MTTTDTPAPQFYDPGFDHAAARGKAIGVVLELDESLGGSRTTSIMIDHAYNVQVQFAKESVRNAVRLAETWSAEPSYTVERGDSDYHHRWRFDLDGVTVRIVLLMDAEVLS
ncbi:MAG TPA: hypothetical protein VNO31_31650 [Umezawaea sp.]|nr:hypothetical protein [Umezawaea sp.]